MTDETLPGVRRHTFADGSTDRLGDMPMTRVSAAVAGQPARSEPEELLAFQLRAAGIDYMREFAFTPSRKWRADFYIPRKDHASPTSTLVEVDGGSWVGGRHTSGSGFEKDCEKASAAAIAGYRVIRCTPAQVESGECLSWIEAAR